VRGNDSLYKSNACACSLELRNSQRPESQQPIEVRDLVELRTYLIDCNRYYNVIAIFMI